MKNFDVKIMFHQGSGMGGWAQIYKMVSRVPHNGWPIMGHREVQL